MPDNGNEWRKVPCRTSACTPCVPLLSTLFNRVGSRRGFGLPGESGDRSIVRWNLRPVIFGVDSLKFASELPKLLKKFLQKRRIHLEAYPRSWDCLTAVTGTPNADSGKQTGPLTDCSFAWSSTQFE